MQLTWLLVLCMLSGLTEGPCEHALQLPARPLQPCFARLMSLLPAVLLLQGYGFCEFTDGSVVNGVIKSLHNSLVEGRKITVKRADDESAPPSTTSS